MATEEQNERKGIPIQWYFLKSLSKMFERKLTESEKYLESQIGMENQQYIEQKDEETLKYLRNVVPNLIGVIGSAIACGSLYLHYSEVDKYYLNRLEKEADLLRSNPASNKDLFPAKNMEGSTIPFKQISKLQQKQRVLMCMGLFFIAGYANGYANYKHNLIYMNDLYYAKCYHKINQQSTSHSLHQQSSL